MGSKKGFRIMLRNGDWKDFDFDEFERELGVVRCTGALGRKRIEPSPCDSPCRTPLKRQCSLKFNSGKSLEALPQDILVKIVCGVEHDDLARLVYVSKTFKDVTLIAKESHFAFRTPVQKTAGLHSLDVDDEQDQTIDSCYLNAPKQGRSHSSRASRKNLADISVALFHTFEKE